MAGRARILTAIAPDSVERVERILHGHELVLVHTIEAAKTALQADGIALIFVDSRFCESRMFDLLDHVRHNAAYRRIPVVAAIVVPTTLSPGSIAAMTLAAKAYGASVFLNVNDFSDDEISNQRLRAIVDALILTDISRVAN